MKFQKLLLATALFCAGAARGTVTPEQKAALEQLITTLQRAQANIRLSPENEELYFSIAQALNYSPVQVKKASPELIASFAQKYVTQSYWPELDVLFVNEEWLNSMPIEERTYTIGNSLWALREMGQAYANAIANKNSAKKLGDIECEADEHIVRTLHCLDGALAVLRKDRSAIEQSCDKDALLNNKIYSLLNSRIAHLETLKEKSN